MAGFPESRKTWYLLRKAVKISSMDMSTACRAGERELTQADA